MFQDNAIFWIDVDKIRPNPFQPRKDFDPARLNELAESIRQYGILQPLTVTRFEVPKDDGGLVSGYELISGERRLRAAKIAGLSQVPATIRTGSDSDKTKLELAIIENLQREDLNPIDRAKAFQQLVDLFGLNHRQIGQKIGMSRVYVTNTIRLLSLPQEIQDAVAGGTLFEGHTRPLLTLGDRPDEQQALFKEIMVKRLNVRESEGIARRIAFDRARKKSDVRPEIRALEETFSQTFGTRVRIEEKEVGGKIVIDFFSGEDLQGILELVQASRQGRRDPSELLNRYIERNPHAGTFPKTLARESSPAFEEFKTLINVAQNVMPSPENAPLQNTVEVPSQQTPSATDGDKHTGDMRQQEENSSFRSPVSSAPLDLTRQADEQVNTNREKTATEDDLYAISNFTL